jgi:hypothetical protein
MSLLEVQSCNGWKPGVSGNNCWRNRSNVLIIDLLGSCGVCYSGLECWTECYLFQVHVLFKAGSAWALIESAPRFVQSARGATRRGAALGIEVCEKRLRGKAREV